MSLPLILLTNDDGIHAPGLRVLFDALSPIAEVHVFAPDRERSAVGHGISLHHPLRVKRVAERWHSVDGTPADCVLLAVRKLLGDRPSMVVSGINNGANLGDDVFYSGTVAGAREGMLLGFPAIAVSDVNYRPEHFETSGIVARSVVRYVLEHGLPEETLLNVNVPDLPIENLEGVAITRMGRRQYDDDIIHRQDPRGGDYYWIGGAAQSHPITPGSDLEAIAQNKASITPIQRDATHHPAIERFYNPPIVIK